jgi:hypothetical protein
MNDNSFKPSEGLVEAARTLRTCQPLADTLMAKGVTIELNTQEQAALKRFRELVLADFSESEWSYMRVVSGVKVRDVAVLKSCLMRHDTNDLKLSYGPL